MSAATDALKLAWRNYVTDGVPASGDNEPSKTEIRAALDTLATELSSIGGGIERYATVAAMNAVTDSEDGQLAYVYRNNDDPDDAANGMYQWNDGDSAWEAAPWYFEAVAAVVQPLVDEAREWAENPEDDDITTAPGHYSALHYSAKAEAARDDAEAAEASAAASALTAIQATPAYTNSGGQGDRQSIITVTTSSGLLAAGTASNLVDGVAANNSTDAVALSAVTVGPTVYFLFDFGIGARKIITEATWKQSGSQSHGSWKWRGTLDGTTFTDIGSSFTLGGSTSQAQAQLASNIHAYQAYRLEGVSGTTSASPYITEVEFKITGTALDGSFTVPSDGAPHAVLRKTTSTAGDYTWENTAFEPSFPTSQVIADWVFNESAGTTIRDRFGTNDINLATPTNPNVTLTEKGAYLAAGLIQTPSMTNIRTVVIMARIQRGLLGNGMLISGGPTNGSSEAAFETAGNANHTYYMGFGEGVSPVGTAGVTTYYALQHGGWAVFFEEINTNYTGPLGFGGKHTATTNRCNEFEIARATVLTGTLTDAQRLAIFNSYRKTAVQRGFWVHKDDTPKKVNAVTIMGDSNADGRSKVADLSAGDQATRFRRQMIMASNLTGTSFERWDGLELGANAQATAPTTDFGFEFGLAVADKASMSVMHDLYIAKLAKGSTDLTPSALGFGGGAAEMSWNPGENLVQGLIWKALYRYRCAQAQAFNEGVGLNFGGMLAFFGPNAATSATYASSAATYQGYHQSFYDFWKTYLGLGTYKQVLYRCHNHDPASNSTALANIRSGQALFAAAQSGVTLIDTDGYGLNSDSVHFNAAASKAGGMAGYSPLSLT